MDTNRPWPTPQDYNEAVQNPEHNFLDKELKSSLVYRDALGLPRPVTGSFASVYRMKCDQRDVAVRCFLQNVLDQRQRYAAITKHAGGNELANGVIFEYQDSGVLVSGRWCVFRACVAPDSRAKWPPAPEEKSRVAAEPIVCRTDMQ